MPRKIDFPPCIRPLVCCLLLAASFAGTSFSMVAQDSTPDVLPTTEAGATEQAETADEAEPFIFGMILVGRSDDHGWSQTHFEGGRYVEENMPSAQMLVSESLNPIDRPDNSLEGEVEALVAQGAQLIFTASDEFTEATDTVALRFPEVTFINISGDSALIGDAPPNVSNVMAQMEWMKMVAGCAAGLMTETGQIGYLGPLINEETRRFAASTYLGARYCYETYRELPADDLTFVVNWIGFWFYVPDFTLDPVQVTNDFYDAGADVVISGIDTPEAIQIAGERRANGEAVFAVPFDYEESCDFAPAACLGVPYYRWGGLYTDIARQVQAGTWTQQWLWQPPVWGSSSSIVRFAPGLGLSTQAVANLSNFISELRSFDNNPFSPDVLPLWRGPLLLQDGTLYTEAGQYTNLLDVWYLPQLLDGMIGASD